MEILKGIGVSPGVTISTAVVLDAEDIVIPHRSIAPEHAEQEVVRVNEALVEARAGVRRFAEEIRQKHGKEIGGIFDFHVGLLGDTSLQKQMADAIRQHNYTAEYATSQVMRRLAQQFDAMPDRYLAERVKDIYDIERRILRTLIGEQHEGLTRLDQDVAVIAHDLLPSQTAALDRTHVKGFATDVGGRTSHTAIVARAMNIPAVVGLGNATMALSGGDRVIIDGTRGLLIIDPDPEQLEDYREYARRQVAMEADLATLRDLPGRTLDGVDVALMANIEFPNEIEDALERGSAGIGLYRTEFLFLSGGTEPTEEEHFQAYRSALLALEGRPLVIRTLDLGADKYSQDQARSPEKNPFLGDRSIRLCLHDLPMFKRQLRAILRASGVVEENDLRIMFPMISTIMELRQAKMVLRDVEEELEDEGLAFRRGIPLGMMIEVPSAALMANNFAREVSFFSIGTNDLIQYTLAVDRTNERVAGLYNPAHPAVLSLIRDVIRAAHRNSIGVSVCGEMAGDPLYTLLLLGLGLTTLSMNGPDVPEVKKVLRSTTARHAREVARRVMSFDSERQVIHYLQEELRKILPETF